MVAKYDHSFTVIIFSNSCYLVTVAEFVRLIHNKMAGRGIWDK